MSRFPSFRINLKRTDYKNIAIIIIYAAITFFTLLYHEPWRDEGQAWLISQNLSFGSIIHHMRYEGHIALWSIFLKIIQFFSSSFLFTQIVIWFINCLAVIFIFKLKDVPFYLKTAITFSILFLYSYSIIIRCYSLMPILLALSLYFYQKKKYILQAVCVALFSNVHIMTMGFAGLVMLWMISESIKEKNKKKGIGSAIIFFGLLFAALQLLPSFTSNTTVAPYVLDATYSIRGVIHLIIDQFEMMYVHFFWPTLLPYSFFIMVAVFLIMFLSLIVLDKKYFLIFAWSFVYHMFVVVFVYRLTGASIFMTSMPRANIIFVIYLYCFICALQNSNKKILKRICTIILSIIFFASIPNAILRIQYDYENPISAGESMAEVIEETVGDDDLIITNVDYSMGSILVHLPNRTVWYPTQHEHITYGTWNIYLQNRNYDSFKDMMEYIPDIESYEDIYFIDTYNVDRFSVDDSVEYEKIYRADKSFVALETYDLYKIND